MSKVHVDHGPAKKRTPESRVSDAKKILESRPRREHVPKGQPRVMPKVLSPEERSGKKPAAKKVEKKAAEPVAPKAEEKSEPKED